jgi:protein-tyrosine phosphatase
MMRPPGATVRRAVGLIDLHCHILPALDDGALDERDSVAMARQAERDGIEMVVATPHIRADHAVRIPEIAGRCTELNARLEREGLRVRVATGGEVAEPIVGALTGDELTACALGGGGRWILLEPAAGPLSDRTQATVRALHEQDFDVVLAHPERHLSEDMLDRMRVLAASGVLIQLTAAFAADDSAHALLEAGLVHVLGSDAHSSHGGRRVELRAAVERIAGIPALGPHVDWIAHTAPRAILAGRALQAPY